MLGLALALAMVKTFRGRGIVMSILIIPLFISPVIVGQSWALFLQRPFGPADYLLSQLLRPTRSTISWVGEAPWVYVAIVLADVWQWTPFMFVILLAGLAAIPPHLYEAAELDGVGGWQTFRYMTLPQLAPMMLLAVTFRLLDAVKLFDVIFMMTGGGPGTQTYTTSFYLYQIGFQQFHLSKATAGSWIFLILLSVVIIALVRRLLESGDGVMATQAHAASRAAAAPRGRRSRFNDRLVRGVRAGAALLGRHHLDQAEQRLPDDAAGLVPGAADDGPLHRGAVLLSGPARADQQPDHRLRRHRALGLARHDDGLQPCALQHRRPASFASGCCRSASCRRSRSCCRSSCSIGPGGSTTRASA